MVSINVTDGDTLQGHVSSCGSRQIHKELDWVCRQTEDVLRQKDHLSGRRMTYFRVVVRVITLHFNYEQIMSE